MSFKSKLNNFIINASSQREELQELIHMALDHLQEKDDTVYLTMLLNRSVKVKSLPTVTIKDYIKAHAPVKYTKNKTGEYTFKQDKNSKSILNVRPSETWYDWKKAKHNNVKDVDHTKLAIKHLKAVNNGTHSMQYLASVLIESGFTTDQLLKMVDSVSLAEVKAA
jgi:hypothetical protein